MDLNASDYHEYGSMDRVHHSRQIARKRWEDTRSFHARVRCQQRGNISQALVDWVVAFGEIKKSTGGADSYFWTKQTLRDLESYVGGKAYKGLLRECPQFPRIYAIVASETNTIITTGYVYSTSGVAKADSEDRHV